MKCIRLFLLLAGLTATGCMQPPKRPVTPSTQTTAVRPVVADAPATKLLPADELSAENAKAQAQILDETLKKEMKGADSAPRN
jgi:hypothetical protein